MRKALRHQFKVQRGRFEEAVELVSLYIRHLMRFRELLPAEEIPIRVSGRVKSEESLSAKLAKLERRTRRRFASFASLRAAMDDIAGVRVICDYLTDVTATYDYLARHNAFRVLSSKTQDYISRPKEGYRALHAVIEVHTSYGRTKCEVQIKTRCNMRGQRRTMFYCISSSGVDSARFLLKFGE